MYIAQYLWLFLCCARLFLTRGRKHEQCHAVDSFDVLGQISEANGLLYFKISAVCSLKKKCGIRKLFKLRVSTS